MTRHVEPHAAAAPARRLSATLSAVCLVLIVALPVVSLSIQVFRPEVIIEVLGLPAASGDSTESALTPIQHAIMVLVGLVPVAFMTYALICARRCFRSFVRGEHFTAHVVRNLRGLAAGIALWVLSGWLTTPLLSLLLTLGAEEHRLTLGFSSSGMLTLLFAGIVWQIADIMTKAVALAEENSQFV
jgi:hypothetical protein